MTIKHGLRTVSAPVTAGLTLSAIADKESIDTELFNAYLDGTPVSWATPAPETDFVLSTQQKAAEKGL